MFDDDLYNFYNSYNNSSTETETEPEQSQTQASTGVNLGQTSYNPYANTSGYDSDYDDDYSVTPNYNEEKSYNSNSNYDTYSQTETESDTEIKRYRKMEMPVIERGEQAVTLTKTQTKVELQPRMKIAITMFAIIAFSLVFLIVWNFVSVGKLNSMIADKQRIVNELSSSITGLRNEYTLVSDEENLYDQAQNAGFVESDDSNTYVVSAGEMFVEEEVQDLPSNWFNDVCDFFTKLFS